MDDVAVLVAKHLDLDVARIDDEFLDEHPVVAERGFRLRARARKTLGDFAGRMRDAHAFAAAAGGRLDHDREADLLRDPNRLPFVVDHAKMARYGRDLGLAAAFLLSILSPMAAIALGFGPIKAMPARA